MGRPLGPFRPHWPRRVFAQLLLSQTVVTVAVTAVTAGLFLAPVSAELDRDAMQRALTIAQVTATDPDVARAAADRDPDTAQGIAERIRLASRAEFVVITDTEGIRLSHTDPARIGLRVSTDPEPALRGEVVTAIQDGTLGRTARGKVPLRLADGRIVGEVSVGLSDDSIRGRLVSMAGGILLCAGAGLVVGLAATLVLARRLKRRTHNIAVADIAALLIEREAMLHGIREGMLALDAAGRIRLANDEALRLLALPEDCTGRTVDDLLPPGRLADVLTGRVEGADLPAVRDDRVLVVNRMATADGGAVTTLRDRTELEFLVRELDHTRGLTEALRAQDHEHANRMHTLLGLLELGRHDQAADFISEQSGTQAARAARIGRHVQDPHTAALLTGKAAVAEERGTRLTVTPDSHLPDALVDARALVTVVGNLVDNAMDAAPAGTVEVRLRTAGTTLLVEVADSGPGIPADLRERVFEEGWSSKQAPAHRPRGLGLALVRRLVERSGGRLAVGTGPLGGARFTVELPEALSAAEPRLEHA
ncbi:ATP-binding protein [Kitasatospora cineracea]|uniref:ATP-binding protein n=1 Tax=Kitasatospora TaxID=2063 RepID=UPI0004C344EB|nr:MULTISPECIES: sensor histidine kinase [unclassified Kitasatospora]WAL70056.1 sensor histidine kinase [Kitasatospora sp. YST-16]WAL76157.1 sensor histidine kinase [Kitasatospora sp. YST-16]WNW42212.1 sensor histidine kinase [Streptomyces sp. Li-HN-5-13]